MVIREKMRYVFHTYKLRRLNMQAKMVSFILVIMGIALYGCTSSPSGSSSQYKPSLDGFTLRESTTYDALEFEINSLQPQYNADDGTITLFSKGNFQIKIMPMTFSGGTRGAGTLSRTRDEFDTLVKQYETNLAADPQDFDACIILAGLYKDGNPDLAVKYSDMALTIRHDDPEALYARGLAYMEKGESSRALDDLKMVLRRNIQSMKGVYYIMGMIHANNKEIDEAIEAFEKVKAIDPEFADIDEILERLYR
jgi:tetratricopeptide (TPR) repeat protein